MGRFLPVLLSWFARVLHLSRFDESNLHYFNDVSDKFSVQFFNPTVKFCSNRFRHRKDEWLFYCLKEKKTNVIDKWLHRCNDESIDTRIHTDTEIFWKSLTKKTSGLIFSLRCNLPSSRQYSVTVCVSFRWEIIWSIFPITAIPWTLSKVFPVKLVMPSRNWNLPNAFLRSGLDSNKLKW